MDSRRPGNKLKPARVWGKTETLDYVRGPEHPALNEPGAKFNYSNTHYTLLGLIIEKITGQPAEAEIRRRVLEPLRMRDTFLEGFEPFDTARLPHRYHYLTSTFSKAAGVARGFKPVRPDLFDATGANLSVEWTAGGLVFARLADSERRETVLHRTSAAGSNARNREH